MVEIQNNSRIYINETIVTVICKSTICKQLVCANMFLISTVDSCCFTWKYVWKSWLPLEIWKATVAFFSLYSRICL